MSALNENDAEFAISYLAITEVASTSVQCIATLRHPDHAFENLVFVCSVIY